MKFKIEAEVRLDKTINKSDIKRGQKRLVEVVREKSDPYVPWLTGELKNTAKTTDDMIIYNATNGAKTSYARKQYVGNRGMGREGVNRGGKRGSRWTERMWEENKEEILEEIKNVLLGGD
ncbi:MULTISPECIES: minor capsid protein [Clostridia]|uniref:minor capsid protein n=1 Tax=Clostridia TaxID=186801 RepID=UPI002A8E1AFF|nr:minor capsid protein [Peptostreptococcus porci]MDY5098792.1 minor capsid protein [Clostridium sp.]MDY5437457.1 minor capsid protein [Peptostreptococcus porci]